MPPMTCIGQSAQMTSISSLPPSPFLEVVLDSEEEGDEQVWSNSSTSSHNSDLGANFTGLCPTDSTTSTSMALAAAARELAFGKLLQERQTVSTTPNILLLQQQPLDFSHPDLSCSALLMKQAFLQSVFAVNHPHLAEPLPANDTALNWSQIHAGQNVAASAALLSAASMVQSSIHSFHNSIPKPLPAQSTTSSTCVLRPLPPEEISPKKYAQKISSKFQCTPAQISSPVKTNSSEGSSGHSPNADLFSSSSSKNKLGRTYNPGRPLSMQDRQKILQLYQKGFKISHIAKLIGVTHSCVSKIMTRYRRTGSMHPKCAQLSRKISSSSATTDGLSMGKRSSTASSSISLNYCSLNGSQCLPDCEWMSGIQMETHGHAAKSMFLPQTTFNSLLTDFNRKAALFEPPLSHFCAKGSGGFGGNYEDADEKTTQLKTPSSYFMYKPIPLMIPW